MTAPEDRPRPRIPGCVRNGLRILFGAALAGCWTPALHTIPETHTKYDSLPEPALSRLAAARADLEAGHAEDARSALDVLSAEFPDNIAVGACLQEAELAAAESGGEKPDLRDRYRKRAEEHPTVASLVLAARLEPDADKAVRLLDRAETEDPHCAWSSYGRAWLAARAGDWKEARDRVVRAKAADPGHMPTLWLETWMLARAGSPAQAITSLSTWIERARGDPRIDPRLVRDAELDRALLAVLEGDPKQARRYLAEIEDVPGTAARRRTIEAGADQELGEGAAALAAAKDAERVKPDDLLPAVQQALLHEIWLGDPVAAEADWKRALEISRSDSALGSLLERMRARVRLERSAAARATPAQGAGGPASPADRRP